jgi:UDP-N-acetylmuramate--alanine ligase
VAEADEYDRAFLALRPAHAIVNNIEADHLDVYGSIDGVQEAFAAFVDRVEEGGTLALGVDDPGVRRLPHTGDRRVIRYGLSEETDVRGTRVRSQELETVFELLLDGEEAGEVRLRMPGRHNVRNALGAAAIAWAVGVDVPAIRGGLGEVRGVERRFEVVHRDENVVIVDDYAHHPTELEATLSSARLGWPKRRLVAVFQPHLYSRTRDFAEEFGEALCRADVVYVTDIYPAREHPIPGVTGELVADAARRAGARDVTLLTGDMDPLETVADRVNRGDVVITLGAGDIDRLARGLAALRAEGNANGEVDR